MNYEKHYSKLINRAQNRALEGYVERHHVVPRCVGGTDDADNIVKLTPEEHYVAHQLLVKMHPSNKHLARALIMMSVSSIKNVRNNKAYKWVREAFIKSIEGQHNPNAKLCPEEVLEIYYSAEPTKEIAKKYNISLPQVSSIKRKRSYKNILSEISDLPGIHSSLRRIPLSDQTVRMIFLDEGTPKYFKETYGTGINAVRNIKERHTYKKITADLRRPGQIAVYKLLPHEVFAIKNSRKPRKKLAETYNVTVETIGNIQNNVTRRFTDVIAD